MQWWWCSPADKRTRVRTPRGPDEQGFGLLLTSAREQERVSHGTGFLPKLGDAADPITPVTAPRRNGGRSDDGGWGGGGGGNNVKPRGGGGGGTPPIPQAAGAMAHPLGSRAPSPWHSPPPSDAGPGFGTACHKVGSAQNDVTGILPHPLPHF